MAAPTLKYRDVVRCLEGSKLQIVLKKTKELRGKLLIDGVYITSISLRGTHGKKNDLGPAGVRNLMNALFLSGDQFKSLVECPMSREEYHDHLKSEGKL